MQSQEAIIFSAQCTFDIQSRKFLYFRLSIMSKNAWAYTDEKDDRVPEVPEAPEGQVQDDSYVTKTNEPIPVTGDNANIADPVKPKNADSDKQLGMSVCPFMIA
jgi:hypothetical protein